MAHAGWIKLHRSLLDWEWYSDVNVCRVFTHLILRANHKDNNWRGILIKRGQLLTSLNTLESETGLSKSKIRTAIKKLVSTQEIAQQSHSQHTVFTVVNYDSYQGDDTQNDKPVTHESHTGDTRIASNKNNKNEDNENKPLAQPEAKQSKFKFNDDQMRFAEWVFGKVKSVTPSMKSPNLESWANTARLMCDSDNLTLKRMAVVFNWANGDSFWQSNILSMDKFRKQFAQLEAKMPAEKKQSAPVKRPKAFGE